MLWECHRCGKRVHVRDGSNVKCACQARQITSVENSPLDIVAVTTFKPTPSPHQLHCVDTWKKFGLEVLVVEGNRPSIVELINAGKATGKDVLLINSDIEVYGKNDQLARVQANRELGIGVRWDYDAIEAAVKQDYGLDAFFIPREFEIPEQGFKIGLPLWDYWLPWYVTTILKKRFDWLGDRTFYHRNHERRWSTDDYWAAIYNFNSQHPAVDWEEWRKNLDPLKIAGALHWETLHTHDPSNPLWTKRWFENEWLPKIPNYGCSCSNNVKPILETYPIRFGEEYFPWSVELHNAVNRELKRPEMSLEQALERWKVPKT